MFVILGTGILEAVRPRAPVHVRLLVLLLARADAAAPDHDPDRYSALVRVRARLSRTGESRAADGRGQCLYIHTPILCAFWNSA